LDVFHKYSPGGDTTTPSELHARLCNASVVLFSVGGFVCGVGACDTVPVTYCPKLSQPGNGTLSTDLVVFDTVVTVACNTGFKHANGQLAKVIRCLDSQNWNDTFLDCQGNDRSSFASSW